MNKLQTSLEIDHEAHSPMIIGNLTCGSTIDMNNKYVKPNASDFQSLMVTIKLFFGLSYLSMPNTFRLTGIVGGVILMFTVALINLITMQQVLKVATKHPGVKSYSELGMRVLGKRGKYCVDLCTIIT